MVNLKIDSAACPKKSEGVDNGILSFYEYVVFPIVSNRSNNMESTSGKEVPVLLNQRPFHSYKELEEAFENNQLNEISLKAFLKDFLNEILTKVKKQCDANERMPEIIRKAYPDSLDCDSNETVSRNVLDDSGTTSVEHNSQFLKLCGGLEVSYLEHRYMF